MYVHLEAPDECGHRGEVENKVKAIELIDEKVLGPMLDTLSKYDRYKILIMPDHPTPLDIKTHTSNPVPFMIFDSANEVEGADTFTESTAQSTGVYIEESTKLMPMFLKK